MGFLTSKSSSSASNLQSFTNGKDATMPIQTKLSVGSPGDPAEKEADAVARKVVENDAMKDKVQPKADEKKDDKLAKKEEKKDDIKKKADDKKDDKLAKKEEEKPAIARSIQAKPNVKDKKAGDGSNDMDAIEQRLNATKGNGRPLETGTKEAMESSFEHDFSDVRIHTDNEAIELCQALNAQAFTHGHDIYFNSGKYDPQQTTGKELLAHELTHVVQQQRHIHRMVQRNPTTTPAGGGKTGADRISGDNMSVRPVQLPRSKGIHSGGKYAGIVKRRKNYSRDEVSESTSSGSASQTTLWKQNVREGVSTQIQNLIAQQPGAGQPIEGTEGTEGEADGGAEAAQPVATTPASKQVYYFKNRRNPQVKLIGRESVIRNAALIPTWNKAGQATAFDVDHIKELQFEGGTNTVDNLELLNFSANRSSGSSIMHQIRGTVADTIDQEDIKDPQDTNQKLATDAALERYAIEFDDKHFNDGEAVSANERWSLDEIKGTAGDALLKDFVPMTAAEIAEAKGTEAEPVVFTSPAGGRMMKKNDITALNGKGLSGAALNMADAGTQTGTIVGTVDITHFDQEPLNIPVHRMTNVNHGGYIKRGGAGGGLETILSRLKFKGLSPIVINSADLVPGVGIVARGKIRPSVKLFKNVEVDLSIEGKNVEISKTFSSGEIAVPPPFKIHDCSLSLFAGTRGVGARGKIDFAINKVGEGSISARAGVGSGFELEGNFEFDKQVFNNASVRVRYVHPEEGDDSLTVSGVINIPKGKINGVKSATINVTYTDGSLTATGDAELDVPGVKSAHLEVNFSGEQFRIAGTADLQHRLIESGRLEAEIIKRGEEYTVNMSGTARPRIPGISSQLTVSYQNGIINISAQAGYTRGMLSGTLSLGFTNQAVGADGKPTGTQTEQLTFYGSGQLTLKLTPWLQATAGVKFLPNGEIEILGRIALPSAVDVFPRKEISKDLFRFPTIEIPIFAIPLGSRSIGLVGTIGGGLQGFAGIGPGQLRDTFLEVKYNPDHEDQTTVTGNARFVVPANAGLRIYARAGIGASVAIARVSGGLELGGSLAIEGEASAAVNVNWTPQTGLQLNAEANISVQPKFKFDVSAYVEASLDLLVTELSEEKRWTLAQFEYGSALTVGLKFPIHYQEGQPFDVSLNDVEFTYPDINLGEFAKGIASKFM